MNSPVRKVSAAVVSCLGKFLTKSVPFLSSGPGEAALAAGPAEVDPLLRSCYFLSPGKTEAWGLKGGRREHGGVRGGGGLFCLRLCLGCALSLIRYLWRKKVT